MALFQQLGWMFLAALGSLLITRWLRLPSLIGYLAVGILLGPLGSQVIHPGSEGLHALAQIGMSALLFIVGLNLRPASLHEVGSRVAWIGLAQITLAFVGGLIGAWIGGFVGWSFVFIGCAFAFNSTILALKSLSDRGELSQLQGKVTASLLLIQDLFATLLLVLIGGLHGQGSWVTVAVTLLTKLLCVGVGAAVLARWILPRLAKTLSSSQEQFVLFAFALPVGSAVLFQLVGLSAEMGALVAGLCLSVSPFRYDLLAKMSLIREIFLVIFFVLLGSSVSFAIPGSLSFLLWGWLFFTVLNPLCVIFLMRQAGHATQTAVITGAHLSHMSEFSLILLLAASSALPLDARLVPLITLLAIGSFCLGTGLMAQADRIAGICQRLFRERQQKKTTEHEIRYNAVLFGCHRVGSDFLPGLKQRRKPFLVVDYDPEAIAELQAHRIPCRYGDASSSDFLQEIGLSSAQTIISTIPSVTTNLGLLHWLKKRRLKPLTILVANSIEEALRLYEAGAIYVILPHALGGSYASQLLDTLGFEAARFREERSRHILHLKKRGAFVATTPLFRHGRWQKSR